MLDSSGPRTVRSQKDSRFEAAWHSYGGVPRNPDISTPTVRAEMKRSGAAGPYVNSQWVELNPQEARGSNSKAARVAKIALLMVKFRVKIWSQMAFFLEPFFGGFRSIGHALVCWNSIVMGLSWGCPGAVLGRADWLSWLSCPPSGRSSSTPCLLGGCWQCRWRRR